ncbi:hypothetical protein ITJ57_14715 [Plantibacter sp. VKM Ac-2880]|uniref:hypothetical protein n=1 Tax=Plantibacter sp. VKM Ac-2880 TaxID=2783827 RepID=UPI00188DE392|nr:hypothetical protein [Plantibacter sp. VKM Ac-2880]MBF4570022.1 hypothetical protein [Plantibacter sp. VKM Ac-2880]
MGRRGITGSTVSVPLWREVLTLAAGAVLAVGGAAAAVICLGTLLFGGIDLTAEVGSTGDGTGPVVLGIVVVCVMIAGGGVSMLRPVLSRMRAQPAAATPTALDTDPGVGAADTPITATVGPMRSYRRERIVIGVLTPTLIVAAGALFVVAPTPVVLLVGLVQVGLAVVVLLRRPVVLRKHRWQYLAAALVSAVCNPITVIGAVLVGFLITGRPLA